MDRSIHFLGLEACVESNVPQRHCPNAINLIHTESFEANISLLLIREGIFCYHLRMRKPCFNMVQVCSIGSKYITFDSYEHFNVLFFILYVLVAYALMYYC